MESIYGDLAHKYFEKGLIPVPIIKGRKNPAINDWANPDNYKREVDIADTFSNCSIGLLLGESTGIIAVDIDKEEALNLVPPSPVRKKGAKGETRFFRYNGESSRKRHDLGIEILSNGNQTVLPPSLHPDGLNYKWITPDTLLDVSASDLPVLPESFIDSLSSTEIGTKKEVRPSDGSRCNHGSHDLLSAMLVAGIHADDTPNTILKNLLEHDEKINPEVSYFICPSRKEWKTNDRVVNALKFVTQGFENQSRKGSISNVKVDSFEISIQNGNDFSTDKEFTRMPLPHLRGIGQEMFDYISETSTSRRSHFIFPAILSVASIAMANRIKFNGVLPNIYCMLIGQSGTGKNRPLDFITELLSKSDLHDLIGDGSVSGDTAAISWLQTQRERIDIIDEGDNVFQTINSSQAYGKKLADIYATLFTSSGKTFIGKPISKFDKNSKRENLGACFSPYVSLIMGITFDAFSKSVTENTIEKGFGARILYFSDNEKKLMKLRKSKPIPQKFIDFMRMWNGVQKVNVKESIDLKNPHLQEFRIRDAEVSREVQSYFESIMENIFKEIYENTEDTRINSTMNRAPEFIPKLALIDACLTQSHTTHLIIHKENIDWALQAFKAIIHNAAHFLEQNINEGPRKEMMKKIEQFIKSNRNGITMKDISNKFRKIDKRIRRELIEDLLEIGIVSKSENNIIRYSNGVKKIT